MAEATGLGPVKKELIMHDIQNIFCTPVYMTRRDISLSPSEIGEIEDIIKEGMHDSISNSNSDNSYIFNTKLKKIKEFCEEHIKIYVKEIISPEEELDFYITQSWLNITEPGESHHSHWHPNSILSGVFYVSSVEDDKIQFYDPNLIVKERISFKIREYNLWNSGSWTFSVINNVLVLFPSWLKHSVEPNEKATKDRISLSFNTFAKGNFGKVEELTELIL